MRENKVLHVYYGERLVGTRDDGTYGIKKSSI